MLPIAARLPTRAASEPGAAPRSPSLEGERKEAAGGFGEARRAGEVAAPGRGGGEERRAGGGEGRKTKAALGFFYTRDRLAWCLDEGRGWRLEAGRESLG